MIRRCWQRSNRELGVGQLGLIGILSCNINWRRGQDYCCCVDHLVDWRVGLRNDGVHGTVNSLINLRSTGRCSSLVIGGRLVNFGTTWKSAHNVHLLKSCGASTGVQRSQTGSQSQGGPLCSGCSSLYCDNHCKLGPKLSSVGHRSCNSIVRPVV